MADLQKHPSAIFRDWVPSRGFDRWDGFGWRVKEREREGEREREREKGGERGERKGESNEYILSSDLGDNDDSTSILEHLATSVVKAFFPIIFPTFVG